MAKTLRLILGDQLNHHHSWFNKKDNEVTYIIMEVMQEQQYVKHHIQKIIGFFMAMRNFAEELRNEGHQIIYFRLDDEDNQQNFKENLKNLIEKLSIEKFEYQLPDEYRLDQQIKEICENLEIETQVFDTEHFYTSREDVKDFFKGKKQYLMESFYRDMRKKHHLLVDNKLEPFGDKWNFDHENRKKYDGKYPLKAPLLFKKDVSDIVKLLDDLKVDYFGNIKPKEFPYPTSRKEALKVLKYFCDELLPSFGRYEDAMLKEHHTLFHSCLSFSLNLKMISPKEVVDQVIDTWQANKKEIDIAQVEGFVRQVIGWREYMRGIYWDQMPAFASKNYLDNKTKLPSWFWDGKVKMNCLKYAINNSLDHAYAHHIQRLMVIGNFALLIGANPNEVDAWYLGVYADAVEWVQITNTRGMSQFADGGLIGSKPYVASANYINKMSNYCSGCKYDKNLRHGDKACPFNSLYWNFYIKHEDKLKKNARIGMVYRLLEKMDKSEIDTIVNQGNHYLSNLNSL
ncbi:cryptochrome/photolyase family protein [Pedobacter sp. SD-b]|uniref:Cryptochrome/photolyase family protein n=1 Tax=Pedobacter segetis TaxID=2793069 RepID=A0ABS1BJW2_9SPHI|nr:cryptochrome/photolyase family protein [Pedobacter segetis]MBK0383173.1 cryptochrome/photolyase family protein [Pedobacter segetis]